MHWLPRIGLGLVLAASGACGAPSAPPPDTSPLTLEAWQALPPESKYEIDTYERLREAHPHLREPPAWKRFLREVVQPAKAREQAQQPQPR